MLGTISQGIGGITCLAGWFTGIQWLFWIGGSICILMLTIEIFSGSLNAGGLFLQLTVIAVTCLMVKQWYYGIFLGSAFLEALEFVFSMLGILGIGTYQLIKKNKGK